MVKANLISNDIIADPGYLVAQGCVYINLSVELDDQEPKLANLVSKGFIGLKNIIRNFLEESKQRDKLKGGVYTNAVAEIVFATALGAAITYGQDKSASNLNRTISALIAYLKEMIQ